jgi:TP901 family phage tail tape measure protein
MADLDRIQLDIVVNLQGLDSVQRLNSALGRMEGATNKVAKSSDSLEKTNWRQIKSWSGLSEHLSMVERNLDAVWRAGVHLKALGGDLIGVSRDIVGTGIAVVDMYREYDYWLRRASLALNTNTTYAKLLDQRIQDVAIAVGLLKPEEVAEAFNIWGAATGVTVDSMEDLEFVAAAVKDIIIATAGAGGNLESNLRGVSAVLGQFNMEMSEAGHVTRVLTLMTERTQADFGDLAQAFSYVGPLAHSLGIEFDDVAQILGALADAGQRGSRAGRGLSMVIEGLSAPSAKAAEALNMVVNGFKKGKREWTDVAFPKGDFIGMNALIVEMARGLFNASDAQRGYVYSTAFSNNATRALIPLIERTIELWREDADAMREGKTILDETKYSLDSAGEFFDSMTSSMTDSINAVIGSFQNSFFPIIQLVAVRIMELAKPVLGFLKEQLNSLADWLRANQWAVDLAVQVGAVVAVVTGLAGIFFSIVGSFILLGAGIAFFIKGLGGIIFAFTVLGSVIAGIAYVIANNVGGIRDALGRLLNELSALLAPARGAFESFAVTIRDIPNMVGPHVTGFFEALAGAINGLADAIRFIRNDPALSELVGVFAVFFGSLLGYIVTVRTLSTVIGTLTAGLWGLSRAASGISVLAGGLAMLPGPLKLVGVVAAAGAALWYAYENNVLGFRDVVNGVISWVNENIPGAIAFLQQTFEQAWTNLQLGAQTLINVVVPAVQSFVSQVTTIIGQLWAFLEPILAVIFDPFYKFATIGIPQLIDMLTRLFEAWVPVFQQLAETVVGVFSEYILPAIGGFMNMLSEHLMPLLGELAEWFKVIWQVIWTVVGGAIGIIVKVITEFVIWVAPYVQGVLDFLVRYFGSAFTTIINIVSSILGAIFDVIRGVMEAIRGVIGVIMSAIKGDWQGVWNGIKGIVSGVWSAISGIVKGALGVLGSIIDGGLRTITGIFEFVFGLAPGSIYGKIKGFIDTLLKFGGDVISGFVKGVGDAVGGAVKNVTGFFGDIIDGVKGFLGIASPARIMLSIGKAIVQGLWEGIFALKDWIISKVQSFINSVIPGPVKDFLGIQSPSKMMAELGEYIVMGLAQGITTTDDALIAMRQQTTKLADVAQAGADRINMALEAQTGGIGTGISVTTANKKVIRLEVEVTSPDGSVDSLTAEQLADLIKGPDLVSALEHMAAN